MFNNAFKNTMENTKSFFSNPNASQYSSKFGLGNIFGNQRYTPLNNSRLDINDTSMALVPQNSLAQSSMSNVPIDLAGLFNTSKKFGWNKNTGLTAFGKNLGKYTPWISGGVSAIQALDNFSDYNKSVDSNEGMIDDILVSAMSNPLVSSYLTSEQMNLLNQLRRGDYTTKSNFGDALQGIGSGLGDAVTAALTGAAFGGVPGAIVGGVGSLVNSGIQGLSSGTEEESAELAALYQALMDAEAQYKSMKRPNFTGLGIQQQYQNMYA
jgi:hypothetical protein